MKKEIKDLVSTFAGTVMAGAVCILVVADGVSGAVFGGAAASIATSSASVMLVSMSIVSVAAASGALIAFNDHWKELKSNRNNNTDGAANFCTLAENKRVEKNLAVAGIAGFAFGAFASVVSGFALHMNTDSYAGCSVNAAAAASQSPDGTCVKYTLSRR